jgi:hypothetical protein
LTLHEIAGPILASLAVILSIIVFKKTLDYHSYQELDSNYMEALKMGIENPFLRDEDWIKDRENEKIYDDHEKNQKYEQYAYILCGTSVKQYMIEKK